MRLPCVGDDGLLAPSSIASEERNAEWSPSFLDGTASGKDQPEAVVRTRPVTRRRSSRARHLQDTNISWMLVLRSDPFFLCNISLFSGEKALMPCAIPLVIYACIRVPRAVGQVVDT